MNTPILHRSLKSPYAQKVMLLMGYLGQPYLSFIAPKGMPRPIEEILVGEYSRRIPILQIGADMYCDSELILRVMAERNNAYSLNHYPSIEEAKQWIKRIETEGNSTIIESVKPLEMLIAYFKNMPPNHALRFITDRIKLAKTLKRPNAELSHQEKTAIARRYLDQLNQQLLNRGFLLTENKPTSVDFTAFTMIYFLDMINGMKATQGLDHLQQWYKTMSQFGTGRYTEIDGNKCLDSACLAAPSSIAQQYLNSPRIGQSITFRNGGFMANMNQGVKGVIVGEDENTIIIRREHERVGTVHVHFPKLDY